MKTQPNVESNSEDEEAFLRSDIHQLSTNIQRNNYNLKHYSNQKMNLLNKRQTLHTSFTQKTNHRLSTEPVNQLCSKKNAMDITSYSKGFNRLMNIKEPDMKKKMTLTGSLKYRRNVFSLSKSKMDTDFQPDRQEEEIRENYRRVEKLYNKGPLKQKMLESWLDGILMQSSRLEVIDESLGNPALKKFQIDQNSLMSRGLKPEDVDRIYGSLFVHSIGFNNNLRELTHGNDEVLKNLWKVFSILLEYCAEGKYETAVGKIERDKQLKISQLQEQIIRRQEIIEKNDELNEIKNIQIFKEVKQLRQDNLTLKNQKDILYEDYQKTEQAFNEEVALRLKFQNKINELFGVHRELGIKHQRLYDDYKKKVIEWNAANQKNQKLTQENWDLKVKNNDLTMEKEKLTKANKYSKQYIDQLKEQREKINDDLNNYKRYYDDERRINKQNKRRITQFQIELKNLTEIVEIKDKSWKETHSEYQLSLEENNRLYNVINEQRNELQGLLYEKKEFNNKILGLMSEASFEKKKREQFTKLYYETDKKLEQSRQNYANKELQLAISMKKVASYEEDIKVNYEQIKEMHRINSQHEEQLHYLRKFKDHLDEVLHDKEVYKEELQRSLGERNEEVASLNSLIGRLELNLKNANQLAESEINGLKSAMQKLRSQREDLLANGSQQIQILYKTKVQLQKATDLYKKTLQDFKSQRFQRVTLKQNYDQSLTIISKKNQKEKEMAIEISELKEQIVDLKRQVHKLQLNLQNQSQIRAKREIQCEELEKQFEGFKEARSGFVHPLIHEDVCENYLNLKEKCRQLSQKILQLENSLKVTIQGYELKINNAMALYKREMKILEQRKDRMIEKKQSETEYEKQQNQMLTKRLQKLEMLAETYTKKIQQRTNQEKDKVYNELIETKTKSIQELNEKLTQQRKNVTILKQEINAKEQKFTTQIIQLHQKHREEITKTEEKISDLTFELDFVTKEKQKIKEELQKQEVLIEEKVKEQIKSYYMVQGSKKDEEEELDNKEMLVLVSKSNWNGMKKIEDANPQIKLRNDMARKIKIAYSHYRH